MSLVSASLSCFNVMATNIQQHFPNINSKNAERIPTTQDVISAIPKNVSSCISDATIMKDAHNVLTHTDITAAKPREFRKNECIQLPSELDTNTTHKHLPENPLEHTEGIEYFTGRKSTMFQNVSPALLSATSCPYTDTNNDCTENEDAASTLAPTLSKSSHNDTATLESNSDSRDTSNTSCWPEEYSVDSLKEKSAYQHETTNESLNSQTTSCSALDAPPDSSPHTALKKYTSNIQETAEATDSESIDTGTQLRIAETPRTEEKEQATTSFSRLPSAVNEVDDDEDTSITTGGETDNSSFLKYWCEEEKRDRVLVIKSPLALHSPSHFYDSKDRVLADFRGKKLYLFLDYDGTLTPIVNNPWEACLSPLTRKLLYDLASHSKNFVTVGIVTGRALTSVKNFVQIVASDRINFIYAASHGFHIEAAGKMLHHRVGSRYIPILKQATEDVRQGLAHIPGVTLEDNEFAYSVHYRNAPEGSEEIIEKIISNIIQRYPDIKMTRGKKVFELRINVVWDKGRAVFWLLNAMRVDPFKNETRIIYMGDDLTDEDAFRAVRQLKNSLTVLVSDTPRSRPTAADCFVRDPSEVAELLQLFLNLSTEGK